MFNQTKGLLQFLPRTKDSWVSLHNGFMKELTIEEKAKRYGEALERAKKLQETCDSMAVVGWCEYIFPELKEKESKDDRTRKAILTGLIDCRDAPDLGWSDFGGINIDECIAWIEKQGEPEDKESDDELTWLKTFIEEEAYYLSMDIRDEVDREKLIKLQNALAWLEKQGKKQSLWTYNDTTMAFTLMRDVDQMTYISNEGKNERLQWLNSLEDKFNNGE